MPENYKKAKPGRYGIDSVYLDSELVAAIANTATSTYSLPSPLRRVRITRISVHCRALATSGAALTLRVTKRDVSAAANIVLTAAIDLLTLVAETATNIPLLGTLADQDLTLDTGDTLKIEVIAAGTVTAQPTGLIVCVEAGVLE